jgi:hypothetical protein
MRSDELYMFAHFFIIISFVGAFVVLTIGDYSVAKSYIFYFTEFTSNICMALVMSLTVFRKYDKIGITPKSFPDAPSYNEVERTDKEYINANRNIGQDSQDTTTGRYSDITVSQLASSDHSSASKAMLSDQSKEHITLSSNSKLSHISQNQRNKDIYEKFDMFVFELRKDDSYAADIIE